MSRNVFAAWLAASAMLAGTPVKAADGWRLEVHAQDGGRLQRLQVLLDEDHLRAAEPGAPEEIVLTRNDVTFLNHSQKSYTRLTFDVIEKMLGGMMEMVEGMKESQIVALKDALVGLSEEEAAAVQEQIDRLEAKSASRKSSTDHYALQDTGETGRVAGLTAKRYAVLKNGKQAGEAWFTDEIPVALLRDLFHRFRDVLPGEAKQGSPFFDVIEDLYGFPVRLVSEDGKGDLDRLEVAVASRLETGEKDFLPEPSYEPQSLLDVNGKNEGGW